MSDLMMALTELRDAQPCYEEAERYYDGDVQEKHASQLMQRLLKGSGTDFRVNLACRPVDAVLDRMEISAVTADPDAATKALNEQVWTVNDLDIEAPELHENGLKYGDAYLYVGLSEEPADDEPVEDDADAGQTVDVFYNSPLTVRVIYDDEHPRRKKLAIKSWCEEDVTGAERTRVNLYYPHVIEKWISKPNTKGQEDGDFEPYVDDSTDENGQVVNESGRIPFFHFRTKRPYGVPVHKNAWGPQDALTKLIVNQMSTADFAAFPQRYATVAASEGTDDDTDWGHDDATDPEDRESGMVSGPGRVWLLRNIDKVGEFTPADVKNFLEPIGMYVRFMAAATSTPMRWFDPSGDVPSGESIRADEAPLIKRIEAFERSFAAAWSEALEYALSLLGVTATVTVQWAPTQTIEDLDGWQAIVVKQQAGVPVRQCLLEAGYTEASVEEWGYTEEQPDGPGRLDDLLGVAGNGVNPQPAVDAPLAGGL